MKLLLVLAIAGILYYGYRQYSKPKPAFKKKDFGGGGSTGNKRLK